MFLVDKATPYRSGTTVDVFVIAPHRKVDIPIVEFEDYVSRGVSKVETETTPLAPRRGGDSRNFEELSRETRKEADLVAGIRGRSPP